MIPMDPTKLIRIQSYIDPDIGEILHYLPIDADGAPDLSRPERFFGKTMLKSAENEEMAIPVAFALKATTLREALVEWVGALEAKVNDLNAAALRARIAAGAQPPMKIVTP